MGVCEYVVLCGSSFCVNICRISMLVLFIKQGVLFGLFRLWVAWLQGDFAMNDPVAGSARPLYSERGRLLSMLGVAKASLGSDDESESAAGDAKCFDRALMSALDPEQFYAPGGDDHSPRSRSRSPRPICPPFVPEELPELAEVQPPAAWALSEDEADDAPAPAAVGSCSSGSSSSSSRTPFDLDDGVNDVAMVGSGVDSSLSNTWALSDSGCDDDDCPELIPPEQKSSSDSDSDSSDSSDSLLRRVEAECPYGVSPIPAAPMPAAPKQEAPTLPPPSSSTSCPASFLGILAPGLLSRLSVAAGCKPRVQMQRPPEASAFWWSEWVWLALESSTHPNALRQVDEPIN